MHGEITEPVELCDDRGRLNPAAVGWARRPIITGNVSKNFPNKRRWHHWGVLDRDVYVTLTCADIDLLMVAALMVIDMHTGEMKRWVGAARRGGSKTWPLVPGTGEVHFTSPGLAFHFVDAARETRLIGRCPGVDVDITVARPEDHETMNVVVAPSERVFSYTSKQLALPASGTVTWRKQPAHHLHDDAFATLDFARGVWPSSVRWRWGCGAGHAGDRQIAISLGSEWTDHAPVNENVFLVDGRLQKVVEEVAITREAGPPGTWRIRGPRCDLHFLPAQRTKPGANLGLVAAVVDHSIGAYTGWIVLDDGSRLDVTLTGWCEEVRLGALP